MSYLTDVPAIADRLRAIRSGASADHVTEGRAWYPAMNRLIREIADDAFHATGDPIPMSLACGAVAAFSQNSTWRANVTMATRYLCGEGQRGLRSVMREIALMEEGYAPEDVIGALKRPDFYRNLMGDHRAVTCDRWHLRAAYGESRKVKLTSAVRAAVTEATSIVAAENGESPAACQAVIWCAVRGTGQ
jgi:hypothetical protein